MLFLLACYFLLPTSLQNGSKKRTKTLVAVLLVIIAIALSNDMVNEAIQQNVFEKISRVSLATDSEDSRFVSALADLSVAIRHPLGAGYDIYHNEWKTFLISNIIDGSSCVGLTQWIAVYGFIPTFFLLIMLARLAIKNNTYVIQTVALMAIYLNTCCSQPSMLFTALLALFIIKDRPRERVG